MAKRLGREFQTISSSPPGFVKAVQLVADNLFKWRAQIEGPEDSPYKGGVFTMEIEIPNEYPFKPPRVKFLTKVYHPNIKSDGSVCAEILNNNWSPQMKIQEVLLTMSTLLGQPNPDTPLEADIAQQYQNDREKFNKIAKDWTKKHAKD
eukprot:CAMPEP_0205824322 /NCGR_PEP_ID=MMETSP0206-20130828/20416_1 /ASSEMBLY_ACC=CAM_ASM_000279 /TAXON_ID=36767 /ORGANISM="Euplotes focardii, Strain TN1" /LENGTH=148 /DNA_ID=CAMNT_0053122335 /DNA_START=39 /DNA_END=485 /DNA_ORIENTATION=+